MATGTWIYEKGTTSGGGTFIPPDAPPAVINGPLKVREVYEGKFEVTIDWSPGAGSPTVGVGIYLEDPDISSSNEAPMDGSIPLDGTSQVSGKWAPVHITDDFEPPALITVNGAPKARAIRVYVQAFSTVKNATLVRANKPPPTPSAVVTIPAAAGQYVSGQEYAWIVTGAHITVVQDFANPAGPMYSLVFGYTAPDPAIPLPPGLRAFGGVMTVYEYDDGTRKEALFLDVNKPDDWHSGSYEAGLGGHFKVWFCSRDVDGRRNTIVKGVTPMIDVTIVYPPVGQPTAPYVTGLALTNYIHDPQPDGTDLARATLTWTVPASPRYKGVEFYRTGVTPPRLMKPRVPANITSIGLEIIDWPKVAEAWTIVAISIDDQGRPSDDPANPGVNTPRVTWNIGPPALGGNGLEYAPAGGASGTTVTTVQELNSDGVVMMRHQIGTWQNPTSNLFGGMSIARVISGQTADPTWWDVPKNATSFTTDWEPAPAARTWDFYFVSRDMTGHRNTILPGTTPKVTPPAFTPIVGNVLASRMPRDWFNEAEFDWPADPAKFTVEQIIAPKIFVGSILRVGGGPSTVGNAGLFKGMENGQVAVYNASNVLRGWIGQQTGGTPDNPAAHSIFGGWMQELYVGGDNPTNAPIYAKQDGTVIIGGFEMAGSRYPYISIRDNANTEVGRIGARIGYAATGNQGGPEVSIQGAWFKEFAYGGQTFTDWRMLAKQDATDPLGATVQMRQITRFTIDYQANYPTATNPTNAAMRLEYGFSAFVTDNPSDSSYYKFPGLSLYRTNYDTVNNPKHGIAIINRGIILRGPNNVGGQQGRLAALVSFNGDPKGNDATRNWWWGTLTMYSPASGNINVQLDSGSAADGNATFSLRDGSGNLNFSVDGAGAVFIRGTLSMNSLSLSGTLSVTGQTTLGAVGASSMVISPGTLNCQQITTNNQSITCGPINAGSNRIDCGIISSNNTITATGKVTGSGFNPTGLTGQDYTIAFHDNAGNPLQLWINGANVGALQIVVRGGVIVSYS